MFDVLFFFSSPFLRAISFPPLLRSVLFNEMMRLLAYFFIVCAIRKHLSHNQINIGKVTHLQ